MQDRFTLRFQNGEREGEIVPVTSPRFTLGRRPGNTLQVQDVSVSGKHAEFVVEADGVLLRDLGSTNSTKVGGSKITEARLAHGDQISFGTLDVIFQDSEFLDAPAPAPASSSPAASALDAGESVERVSADMIARSGQRSRVALIGMIVLLLLGGGAAAFFFTGGVTPGGRKVAAVVEVAGNRIGGYSFEGESIPANWSNLESAPADFGQRGEARASGQDGMRAVLAAGQWAVLQCDPVSVSVGDTVELTGKLRARSRTAGRIGVEFLGDQRAGAKAPGSNVAWGPWIADVTKHQTVNFDAAVPAGCRSARVLVEARAVDPTGTAGEDDPEDGGHVDVDDISMIDGSTDAAHSQKIGEYSLWLHGVPAGVGQLTKVSRSLVGDMHVTGPVRLRDYPLGISPLHDGFRVGAPGATALSLRVEPSVVEGGVASISNTGYLDYSGDFDVEGATTLLLGSGHDLAALRFGRAMSVKGRRDGAALRIVVQLSEPEFVIQVDFREERARAGDLAFAARNAEQSGQLGECLAKWNELLSTAPYEAKLVQEARDTRGRLEQAGLIELADVSKSFEQARFFRLVDLYRQCKSRAREVGSKYAGSAVETQAGELVAEIEESLAGLEADLSRDEVERLESILKILEQTESPRLANEVRSYIKEEFGGRN